VIMRNCASSAETDTALTSPTGSLGPPRTPLVLPTGCQSVGECRMLCQSRPLSVAIMNWTWPVVAEVAATDTTFSFGPPISALTSNKGSHEPSSWRVVYQTCPSSAASRYETSPTAADAAATETTRPGAAPTPDRYPVVSPTGCQ